jgi:NAD(P)H-dependent FMN reductase
MNIVTISGSARQGNYTGKALAVAQAELRQMKEVTLTTIDPATLKLAIPGSTMDDSDSKRFQELVAAADGVILATPEYHGSFSSLVKLTIENMGFPSALKEKPVGLVGVAGGRIGAVKSLEHLRSVCSHIGALVLPRSVSVAGVQSKFDKQGNCLDEGTERQLRGLASELVRYIYEAKCPEISFEAWARDKQDNF